MRVDVSMTDKTEDDRFHVSGWWAKVPDYVIESLRSQLEAAQAVWPELKDYALAKKRDRRKKQ